jgi:hypothetical protein
MLRIRRGLRQRKRSGARQCDCGGDAGNRMHAFHGNLLVDILVAACAHVARTERHPVGGLSTSRPRSRPVKRSPDAIQQSSTIKSAPGQAQIDKKTGHAQENRRRFQP